MNINLIANYIIGGFFIIVILYIWLVLKEHPFHGNDSQNEENHTKPKENLAQNTPKREHTQEEAQPR